MATKCDYLFCKGGTDKDGGALLVCKGKTDKEFRYHLSCYIRLSDIAYEMHMLTHGPCEQRLRMRRSRARLRYYRRRHIERHACEKPSALNF